MVVFRPSRARDREWSNVNGYWTGNYEGSNFGLIVVEIDDRGDHFSGHAYTYDKDPAKPSTFAVVKTPDKSNSLRFNTQLTPIDPRNLEPTNWGSIKHLYAINVTIPITADVECHWDHHHLTLDWVTNQKT